MINKEEKRKELENRLEQLLSDIYDFGDGISVEYYGIDLDISSQTKRGKLFNRDAQKILLIEPIIIDRTNDKDIYYVYNNEFKGDTKGWGYSCKSSIDELVKELESLERCYQYDKTKYCMYYKIEHQLFEKINSNSTDC